MSYKKPSSLAPVISAVSGFAAAALLVYGLISVRRGLNVALGETSQENWLEHLNAMENKRKEAFELLETSGKKGPKKLPNPFTLDGWTSPEIASFEPIYDCDVGLKGCVDTINNAAEAARRSSPCSSLPLLSEACHDPLSFKRDADERRLYECYDDAKSCYSNVH